MNRYVLRDRIGQGTFGIVFRATKKEEAECGKFYAVKKLKQTFLSWKDVVAEREFKAIEAFMGRRAKKRNTTCGIEEKENIVDLYHGDNDRDYLVRVFEVLRERDSSLYFVMEYMKDRDLQAYIAAKFKFKSGLTVNSSQTSTNSHLFNESETRSILYQVFRGLRHIHSLGYIHRDIKPENVLLHGRIAKLADFSLARPFGLHNKYQQDPRNSSNTGKDATDFREGIPTTCKMTNYIGTRWYRAPELLLKTGIDHGGSNTGGGYHCVFYTEAIDMFAMGCVAAELYRCQPLFQGKDEKEQLQLIENLLLVNPPSSPSRTSFLGSDRFDSNGFFDNDCKEEEGNIAVTGHRVATKIETTDPQTVHFIHCLLRLRPERRINTWEVLLLDYFQRERMSFRDKPFEQDNIPNATRIRRFSNPTTPRSTEAFPPTNPNIHSPGVLCNTIDAAKHKNHSLPVLSSVRITPTTATSIGGLNVNSLADNNVAQNNEVKWGDIRFEDKTVRNTKESSRTIHTRKRQKLCPSQIFKID